MSGGAAGEHGIMGIGDGFVPDLVDLAQVDEVARVGTAEADAACRRILGEHGYCVGRSAGANTVAAERLHARGLSVATVFPDCSDRYASVGLAPPSAAGRCPLSHACALRARELLA
jgi:cysteine synthase